VTRSTADVSSTERVTVIFSSGVEQKLSFEGSSNSVGADAGAGNDEFTNAENGSIHAEAVSTANVEGVTTTYEFPWAPSETKTMNLADAIAQSTAVGIDLGAGRDVTHNAGELQASGNANADAKAISDFDLWDETDADADAIAKASAWGINAGSGGDQVLNRNLIQVNASADATSFAQGSKVGSKDDTSTVTEDSNEGSKTFVDASLIPAEGQVPPDLVGKWVRFLTGENEDFFTRIVGFDPSTGTVTILDELPGDLKAADVYTFSAARNGTSASVASAIATGIDVGDGNAVVENTGMIRVKAFAKADTAAKTFGGQAAAKADSSSEARGINTGTGDDVVWNAGVIDVESEVVTTTSGGSATEIATATGIDAGNGNNKIVNEGEINITASVDQSYGEAKARGIITGGGEDSIYNYGSITTTVNGVVGAGVGIHSGGGNDRVILGKDSSVEGAIALGEGDDSLHFFKDVHVTGEITGGDGIDTLTLEEAATCELAEGTLNEMERLEVNEGTLSLDEYYELAQNGYLQVQVNGNGSSGLLQIVDNDQSGTSTLNLDGTMKVIRGPGAYIDGRTYDVALANTINDTFGDVILPAPTPLLSFNMNQQSDRIQVETSAKSFTTVARNRLQGTIAQYLDRVTPTATGDLSEVIGNFQFLSSGSEFPTAFSSLSPDSYDITTRTTYDVTRQQTRMLQQRMQGLRPHFAAPSAGPRGRLEGEPLLLAYNGSDAGIGRLLDNRQRTQDRKKYGLWFQGFGQWGDQDEEDGYTGFDFGMVGLTFGFDYALTDRLLAGVSVDYANTDIDLDRNAGDGTIEGLGGSLYGSYFTERAYIEGVLSYGRQQYDNDRNIVIGPVVRTARSDHDGDAFSFFGEGGYHFPVKGWTVGPFASLHYIYLDEESFVESSAGGVSLLVDDRTTDSLVSELGLRLGRVFQTASGSLVPEVSLAWKYDFDIDDRDITASFVGSPGAAFTIEGQDVDDHGATFGAGLSFIHKSGFSTSLEYNAELRENYTAHGIIGQIRYVF
jgi:outer membrane autotransporter protein